MALLTALRTFLAAEGVSRRAVFNTLDWLKDLPPDQPEMLTALLAYQLSRQSDEAAIKKHDVPTLARRLSDLAFNEQQRHPGADPRQWLRNFLSAAEFLARETRRID